MLLIFLGCILLFSSTFIGFFSLVNNLKKVEKLEANINQFHHQYLLQTLGMQRFMLHGYQDTLFLQHYQQLDIDQFLQLLQNADSRVSTLQQEANNLSLLGTADSLTTLIHYLHQLKTDVAKLKRLYFTRGFKNYGAEGNMRASAHALEHLDATIQPQLLQLRRIEKDFLLRNEQQYIRQFDSLARAFEHNNSLPIPQKKLLSQYHYQFDSLASIVNQIGNYQVSGKYQQTLQSIKLVQLHLEKLDTVAHTESTDQINRYKNQYLVVGIVLVLLLLLFAFLGVKQIAQDIIYLKEYIKGIIEAFLETGNVKPIQPHELQPSTAESESLLLSFNTLLQKLNHTIKETNTHKSHLLAVIEHTENGYCLLSENLNILHPNDALKKLFTTLQLPIALQHKPFVEYAKALGFSNTNKLVHVLQTKKTIDYQQKITLPNQEVVWLQWKLFPILHSNTREKIGYLVQVSNITGYKNNLIRLSKSNVALKTYNNRLKNFAYIISHNLRSHAGNILSLTSMIQQKENPEDHETYVNLLAESAKMLIDTITDLHQTVSIQTTDIEKTSILVAEHIERILLHFGLELEQVNGQVHIDIPPNATLYTNSAYFESIVWNLVSNGIKYKQPNVPPFIIIRYRTNCLQITDNGLGIDLHKYKDKIFGLYKTFHKNADAKGMGLFITKNQVEALGANITVASRPNEGTTFTITF